MFEQKGEALLPQKAIQRVPQRRQEERRLVEGLARCGGVVSAGTGPLIFAAVPQNIRRTWVHALQSALWNLVASDRMRLLLLRRRQRRRTGTSTSGASGGMEDSAAASGGDDLDEADDVGDHDDNDGVVLGDLVQDVRAR